MDAGGTRAWGSEQQVKASAPPACPSPCPPDPTLDSLGQRDSPSGQSASWLANDSDHHHLFDWTRLAIFSGFRGGHRRRRGHHGPHQHQPPPPALGLRSPRPSPITLQLANPQGTLAPESSGVAADQPARSEDRPTPTPLVVRPTPTPHAPSEDRPTSTPPVVRLTPAPRAQLVDQSLRRDPTFFSLFFS